MRSKIFQIKNLGKNFLLGATCLALQGCSNGLLFKSKPTTDITPTTTIIGSQKYEDEHSTSSSHHNIKQPKRALPRRPQITFTDSVIFDNEETEKYENDSTYYTVQKGDTLSKISKSFHVSIEQILIANHLTDRNRLAIGQVLLIPNGGTQGVNSTENAQMYTVRKGDTLSSIAVRFNTTVSNIRNTNHLTKDTIYVGQKLSISVNNNSLPTTLSKQQEPIEGEKYVVQPGDILWNIAQRCGMSVQELIRINNITDPKALRIGQVLYVKSQSKPVVIESKTQPILSDNSNASSDDTSYLETLPELNNSSEPLSPTTDSQESFEDLFGESNDIPFVPLENIR